MNIVQNFKKGLQKSSRYLTTNIFNNLKNNKIDDETVDSIESTLISADIGLEVTSNLITKINVITKQIYKAFNNNTISTLNQERIINISNKMLKQKLRPSPYFKTFFNVVLMFHQTDENKNLPNEPSVSLSIDPVIEVFWEKDQRKVIRQFQWNPSSLVKRPGEVDRLIIHIGVDRYGSVVHLLPEQSVGKEMDTALIESLRAMRFSATEAEKITWAEVVVRW